LIKLISIAGFFADFLNFFDCKIGKEEDEDDVNPALEHGSNLFVIEGCSLKPIYDVV
jgi:hypothetical protein